MPSKVQKRTQLPPSRRLYGNIKEVLDTFHVRDYTVQHIQLALTGLQADQVPDRYGDPWDQNVEAAAIACLGFLLKAGALCRSKPPAFKEALVNGIVEVREAICGWIRLLIQNEPEGGVTPEEMRKRALSNAKSLSMFVGVDPRVAYAFLETPAFVDCLQILWTMQDATATRDLSFIIDLEDAQEDAILGAIWRFVYIPRARDAFVDMVVSTNVIMFAAATSGRAVQLRDLLRSQGYSPAILAYAKRLIEFWGRIMTSDNGELRWAFVESEYITQLGGLLYDLAYSMKRSAKHRKSLKDLAEPAYNVAITIDSEKCRVVRNWADLAGAKFEPTLAFITLNLTARDIEEKDRVTDALIRFGAYTVFPGVIQRVVEARRDQDTDELCNAQHTTGIGIHWKEFWISTYGRATLREEWAEKSIFDICDNRACDGTHRIPGAKSKQCSRCSSVVYCSEHCQRLDWTRQHRSECSHARGDHFNQRDAGAWYSHTSRAYHLKHLETIVTKHFDQMEKARAGAPISTYIATIDCTTAKDRIEIYRIKNKAKPIFTSSPRAQFPQEWLEPRLKALADEFVSGSMGDDMRVVEGVFPHGVGEDIYLPVLLKKVGDKFEAVYSVPGRRGLRPQESDSDSESDGP